MVAPLAAVGIAALIGAALGGISAAVQGGNAGDIFEGGFKGAVMGGIGGSLAGAAGAATSTTTNVAAPAAGAGAYGYGPVGYQMTASAGLAGGGASAGAAGGVASTLTNTTMPVGAQSPIMSDFGTMMGSQGSVPGFTQPTQAVAGAGEAALPAGETDWWSMIKDKYGERDMEDLLKGLGDSQNEEESPLGPSPMTSAGVWKSRQKTMDMAMQDLMKQSMLGYPEKKQQPFTYGGGLYG